MKKYILLILSVFFVAISFAQTILDDDKKNPFHKDQTDSYKMSNIYGKNHHMKKKVVELSSIREADVMWGRKIWRDIDLKQKINHPLFYPQDPSGQAATIDRENLFTVLYNAATFKGEVSIRAFDAKAGDDDEFKEEITATDLITLMEGTKKVTYEENQWGEDSLDFNGERVERIYDEEGELINNRENEIRQSDIKKWRVKEHWFFDKQRSVMDVRIIGLCPMANERGEDGKLTGNYNMLCWFYFPEVRTVIRNAQAFNLVKNEAENRTFEDIFMKRMFASTIVKEGNVFDRGISEYMIGLDALLAAEKIKTELFNIEHDLWEY